MGLLVLFAWAALAAPQESAAGSSDGSVPPALFSSQAAPSLQSAPDTAPTSLAIPAQDPPRTARLLEDHPEGGPSVGGFVVGSAAVIGLLGGALLVLRRFGKNSRFLGSGGPIRVLARKALGPKQEVFLVDVGVRVFMIGSTREHLTALGEFSGPDEVASLRASLSPREDSQRVEFRESLREGLRDQEAPREDRVFASIADELAEIRKTVRAWRA
ncbi:MAG TPA: flagellar biosynthetic protein FliO [Planctomycetota bacterium]|nr:flagellar biosynthetic protein FliO [Planctomycetota bacterium]